MQDITEHIKGLMDISKGISILESEEFTKEVMESINSGSVNEGNIPKDLNDLPNFSPIGRRKAAMDLITLLESYSHSRKGRSIKSLKPNPKSHFKDGYFPKDKCNKYISINNEPCIYRSSLEFKTFLWCENSIKVKSWASEPFSIPYFLSKPNGEVKKRNYNIDLAVEFHDGRLWFVEIKPIALTKRGSFGFEMNAAKWNASILWCKEQDFDIEFKIITEKFNFLV